MPLDPLVIAEADKHGVLLIRQHRRDDGECALCAAPLERYEWVVTLPNRLGIAQPHCAVDAGWRVR